MVQRNKGFNISIRSLGTRKMSEGQLELSRSYDINYTAPVAPIDPGPTTIPGLMAWYIPEPNNVTLNGTKVQSLASSGAVWAPNFAQGTLASMPEWIATGSCNNKPALAFLGVTSSMQMAVALNMTASTQATVFIVMEPHSSSVGRGASRVILEPVAGTGSAKAISAYSDTTTSTEIDQVWHMGEAPFGVTARISASNYSRDITGVSCSIMCAIFDRSLTNARGEITASCNFSALPATGLAGQGTGSNYTDATSTFASDQYSLGCSTFNLNGYFSGSIYEILIYSRVLTTSEILGVRNYLSGRYCPTISTYERLPELNPLSVSSSFGQGCYAWYRGDAPNVTLSGGAVFMLSSSGTPGITAFRQVATASMPYWISSGSCNGKPALHFDNARNMATVGNWNISAGGTSTGQATIFIVAEPHSSSIEGGLNRVLLEPVAGSGTVKGISAYFNTTLSTAPHIAFAAGEATGSRNLAIASSSLYKKEFSEASCSILCATFDRNAAQGAEISMSFNYSQHPVTGNFFDNASINTTGDWSSYDSTLGCRASGGISSFFSGSIYEIIIYDHVLSASEITTVRNYLSGRYCPQIQTYLPTQTTSSNTGQLAFWVRGDQVSLTGTNVGVIKELTFGVDLTQSNPQYTAPYIASGNMKGKQGIYFPKLGNSGSFANRTTHTRFSGTRDITMFVVVEPSPTATCGSVFYTLVEHNINLNTDNGFTLGLGTGTGTPPPNILFWGVGADSAGATTWGTGSFATVPPLAAGKRGMIIHTNVTSKQASIGCLTASVNTVTTVLKQGNATGNTEAFKLSKTYIGARGGNSSFMSGVIYEVLIYDHILNPTDFYTVYNYLSSRYV